MRERWLRIVQMRQEGHTLQVIADTLGISKQRVSLILQHGEPRLREAPGKRKVEHVCKICDKPCPGHTYCGEACRRYRWIFGIEEARRRTLSGERKHSGRSKDTTPPPP